MTTWTVDQMLAARPCEEYTRERIAELWAGRDALSLLDILDLPIPGEHRVWVACRPGALTASQRTAWLDGIVTRAVTTYALHCGVGAVETWAARWLDGTDRTSPAAAEAARSARSARSAWAAEAARAAVASAWAAAERDRQIGDLRTILSLEAQR